MKKAIKSILFIIILLILTFGLQKVMIPKWETDGLWEPITNMVDGFYHEEKNSLDVIYLGSSNAFYDVNPLVIWEEYGITGYVLGSGEQRLPVSYYYLLEALKTQKPKVVVLECLNIFATGNPTEEQNRKAFDYMKLSKQKIESLKTVISEEESLSSYIFPIIRYHGRIWELSARDFTYLFADKHYPLKGYAYSDKQAENLPSFDMEAVVHENLSVSETNRLYMDKIKELCEENQIQLVLMKTPNIEWGINEHKQFSAYAESLSLPYYDYNAFFRELGIKEVDCFLDGAHLNGKGAELLSRHLGGVLVGFLEEKPTYSEAVIKQWSEDLQHYETLKSDR